MANIFRTQHTEKLWANLGAAIEEFKTLIKVEECHKQRIAELEDRIEEVKREKTVFLIFNGDPSDPKVAEYLAKRSAHKPEVVA